MNDSYVLKTHLPEQKLTSSYRNYIKFISMHATDDDVNVYDGLGYVYVWYKSRALTARELPD